ncbi:hypothetical protein [Acinetobacter nosocomialis]
MARYFDLFSNPIEKEQFDKLREHFANMHQKHTENEPSTVPLNSFSVREYQNEKLCVQLIWSGEVNDKEQQQLYKSLYPVFKILILNKRSDGRWYEEPIIKTYFKRDQADSDYEDILMKYTSSFYDEEGNFQYDEDNKSKCIHEQITAEGLEEDDLPTITFKPKTNFDSVW